MIIRMGRLVVVFIAVGLAAWWAVPTNLYGDEKETEPAATPEEAVRRFLIAMVVRQTPDEIERAMLPHPNADILWFSAKPVAAADQAAADAYFSSLELKQLKVGDTVGIPGGKSLVLDQDYVNETRAQVKQVGAPLPYIVVKTQLGWLVNASPVIDGRRRAVQLGTNKEKLKRPWTAEPDPNAGEARVVGRFEIRPPEGYAVAKSTNGLTTWAGPARVGSPRTQIVALVRPVEPNEVGKSLEDAAELSLDGMRIDTNPAGAEPRFDEWIRSEFERGQIDGVPFVRVRWGCIRKAQTPQDDRGLKMHGLMYVTHDGNRVQWFTAIDFEPHYRETIRACESAFLRMRAVTEP